MGKSVVIICDGVFPKKEYPRYLIQNADYIACCDGAFGAYLRRMDAIFGCERLPDVVIGDMDSISPRLKKEYEALIVVDQNQDNNDQTKAVEYVLENVSDISEIHILGATGKREDHSIANISLLMEYMRNYGLEEKGIYLDMISDFSTAIPITDSISLDCGVGRRISIFTPDPGLRIKSKGLVWPLDDVIFDNWWKASLNKASADTVYLEFSHPSIAIIVMN